MCAETTCRRARPRQTGRRWLGLSVIVGALPLAACQPSVGALTPAREASRAPSPAAAGPRVPVTDLSPVRLTSHAAGRLDIKTMALREALVTRSGPGTPRKVIPYAAVLYSADGKTWVYTHPEPLTFVRQRITVEYIEGDLAVLSEGPRAGTEVVAVGADLLFATEFEAGL